MNYFMSYPDGPFTHLTMPNEQAAELEPPKPTNPYELAVNELMSLSMLEFDVVDQSDVSKKSGLAKHLIRPMLAELVYQGALGQQPFKTTFEYKKTPKLHRLNYAKLEEAVKLRATGKKDETINVVEPEQPPSVTLPDGYEEGLSDAATALAILQQDPKTEPVTQEPIMASDPAVLPYVSPTPFQSQYTDMELPKVLVDQLSAENFPVDAKNDGWIRGILLHGEEETVNFKEDSLGCWLINKAFLGTGINIAAVNDPYYTNREDWERKKSCMIVYAQPNENYPDHSDRPVAIYLATQPLMTHTYEEFLKGLRFFEVDTCIQKYDHSGFHHFLAALNEVHRLFFVKGEPGLTVNAQTRLLLNRMRHKYIKQGRAEKFESYTRFRNRVNEVKDTTAYDTFLMIIYLLDELDRGVESESYKENIVSLSEKNEPDLDETLITAANQFVDERFQTWFNSPITKETVGSMPPNAKASLSGGYYVTDGIYTDKLPHRNRQTAAVPQQTAQQLQPITDEEVGQLLRRIEATGYNPFMNPAFQKPTQKHIERYGYVYMKGEESIIKYFPAKTDMFGEGLCVADSGFLVTLIKTIGTIEPPIPASPTVILADNA